MSIADRVTAEPQAVPAHIEVQTAAAPPPATERELRLDMFRGFALWLIFIDHVSPDVLSWFTIRSYGFCDAAEIFIFISLVSIYLEVY